MSYLLDTNVISEIFRSQPDAKVMNWFHNAEDQELYISVLTLGEIRKGCEKLAPSNKKQKIVFWLEHELVKWFEERLLLIDAKVADKWGYLNSIIPKPLPVIDTLLAATALVHNLKMVTRNVEDFQIPGLEVINPWI